MTSHFKFLIVIIVLLLLPFDSITAQEKDEHIVIGKYDKIYSKLLNEERTLLISLPKGYEYSQEKYPVIYVLDGDFINHVRAFGTINYLTWSSIPRMIIVSIKNTIYYFRCT